MASTNSPAFLIYVDEFGNTGDKLDTPKQPIYHLQAAFVPADSRWIWLERQLLEVANRLASRVGLKGPPHLHAVEIYQRSGYYRKPPTGKTLEPDEAFDIFEQVLDAARNAGVLYASVSFDKDSFLKIARKALMKTGKNPERVKRFRGFRQFAFLTLLEWVDSQLRAMDAFGYVIFEEERPEIDKALSLSSVYTGSRQVGYLQRLLDAPSAKAKRTSLLLSIADFAGYVLGNYLLERRYCRTPRPKISKWFEDLVAPQVIGGGNLFLGAQEDVGTLDQRQLNDRELFRYRLASLHLLTFEPEADLGKVLDLLGYLEG